MTQIDLKVWLSDEAAIEVWFDQHGTSIHCQGSIANIQEVRSWRDSAVGSAFDYALANRIHNSSPRLQQDSIDQQTVATRIIPMELRFWRDPETGLPTSTSTA